MCCVSYSAWQQLRLLLLLQGLDIKCTGTVKMLIDMELLAHADYLVASGRSKWSKILQYMRYILYGGSPKHVQCRHHAFKPCTTPCRAHASDAVITSATIRRLYLELFYMHRNL